MSYIPFTNFVFRTPAFSIEKWENFILDMKKGNNDNLLFDNYFLEAIFIGSPILYGEILKYKEGRLPPVHRSLFVNITVVRRSLQTTSELKSGLCLEN